MVKILAWYDHESDFSKRLTHEALSMDQRGCANR